jgi:WD40 repeat protein
MNGGAPLPESPYKGLASFDDSELDERFFFGRDRETEIVASNLVASRLSVLYGPSGVGKSSLLRAGVVRRLRALVPAGGGGGDGNGALPVVVDQWRDDPLAAIAAAAGTPVPESPEELADVLAERSAQVGGEIYLVLDQMEEYFVYHGRDRGGPLREGLAEILTRPTLRVHVLLGIRDDALADLDAFKGRVPGLFGNVLRLDHLDVAAARAAIVEPLAELEAMGGPHVVAEAALVAAVVDQVASGRIERRLAGRGIVEGGGRRGRVEAPYLQLVMERIWEEERAGGSYVLRAATLTELGGAGRIVQQHLERALANLDAPERELVARLFHQLVTPSGTKIAHGVGDLSRYAGESPERLEDVLHALSDERVVRALPAKNGGGPRYEIYHDVLAGAVLDWGARHEAERALADERAAARRRHRRLAAIIGFGAVALAAMGLLTAYAFQQRSEAQEKTQAAEAAQAEAEQNEQKAEAQERKTNDALAESERRRVLLVKARDRADTQTDRANKEADRANDETDRANAEADRANGETARANREAERAKDERDNAKTAKADAVQSKNAEVVQRKKAERAFKNEQRAKGQAITSRDQSRASALVAEAISLLNIDPEQSVRLALQSAPIASTSGLEDTLRDALMNARASAVLPSGSGRVNAVDLSSSGASASAVTSSGSRSVNAVRASADGTLVLVGGEDGEVRVYELASRRQLARLPLGAALRDAVFSPDGKSVFTGDANGIILRWDIRSGARIARAEHGAPIRDLAVSSDGNFVASAAGQAARVWLATDGSQVALLPHPSSVERVSFSVTGGQLLTVARDARVYDARSWGRPPVLLDQPGNIVTAAFSPAGDRVATGGRDNVAMIWDAGAGTPLHRLPHRGNVLDVAWSPNGSLLATASTDNSGRVYRTDTGALLRTLGDHSNQVVAVGFSPDGTSVVTASLDQSARIWSGDEFSRPQALLGHSGDVLDAMFTPDGKSVITASDDGSARVWAPAVDPILSVVGRHTAAGRGVAVASDGRIATVGLDGALRIWRRDGRSVRVIAQPAQAADVAFSRDGSLLLTAGVDGVARVWGADDGRLRQSFAHGAPLTSAAFDPAAKRVVTGGTDGIARVWNRAGGTPGVLRHGGGAVTAVTFSPDGRFVATAGVNIEGRVWRAGTAKLVGKLIGQHEDDLTAIAYSPDGKLIATASLDAEVHLWNAPALTHRRRLRGHTAVVSDVVFSPDGRWIATAGPTTVGMWKTKTVRRIDKSTPVLFLRGHGPRVRSVAFFPDSRRVASIGDDGTVRTYLCELCGTAPQLAVRARRLLDRLGSNLTSDERKKYIGG